MLQFFLIVAMLATSAILIAGIFSIFKSGQKGKKYGNKLMVWRIWLQGIALIIFAVILYMKGK